MTLGPTTIRYRRSAVRRTGIGVLTALLALTSASTPAFAGAARPKPPAQLSSVGGTTIPAKPATVDTLPSMKSAPRATWPTPATADVVVAGGTALRAAAPAAVSWAAGLPVGARRAAGDTSGAASRVRFQVLDHGTAQQLGSDLVVRVSPVDAATAGPVGVAVDYRGFRNAYGADWARRLRLVALPECALRTPQAQACQAKPLATTNDGAAGTLTAEADLRTAATATATAGTGSLAAGAGGLLVALTAGPSSDGGDFTATGWKPSNTWDVSSNTGDFVWQYPLRMPPNLGGPSPTVGLNYSSQSVDGQTSATNAQPTWIGEGFAYDGGSIERRYRPCRDDGQAGRDDLCWAGDNAVMTLNGHSTPLVFDAAKNLWAPQADDGSKIELLKNAALGNGDLDGEYWKVTTPEGVQYFFGLHHLPGWQAGNAETNSVFYAPVFGNNANEPCNSTSGFAASSCQQAYRWNLDYVLDPHGNSMSYYYARETNKYARNQVATDAVSYVSGGYLKEIDYGTRQDNGVDSVFAGTAPARVLFDTTERCITAGATCTLTTANASNWPDVPVDLICTGSNCAGKFAPTFFSTRKLSTVTTQIANGTKSWRRVEQWRLTHEFKSPGDGNPSILWLSKLDHCGTDDNTCMPSTTFVPTQKTNRVDPAGGTDSIIRYRMLSINTDTGGLISISYSAPECSTTNLPASPDTNTKRCFPAWWTPPGSSTPKMEYFHKYVVTAVATGDKVGGSVDQVAYYNYLDTPAWHYDDDAIATTAHRTWGQWRGYGSVEVLHGDNSETQSRTVSAYFRGMNGDKTATGTRTVTVADSDGGTWPDDNWFAGQRRETVTYNGVGGAVVSKTKDDPYVFGPTAAQSLNGSSSNAYVTAIAATTDKTALDAGRGWRTVRSATSYLADRTGRVSQVDDQGDTATTADDQCTRTTYAANAAGTMLTFVTEVETVAVKCATNPDRSTQVISDERTWFDHATAYGTTVSKGDVTRTERLSDWNGGSPLYQQERRTNYDDYGRPTQTYDALDHLTTLDYTPAAGAPVTRTVSTNVLGWQTKTDFDPGWNLPTRTEDVNGLHTDTEYDGLGRLVRVWEPDRVKGTDTPSAKYDYTFHNGGLPNLVVTSRINAAGNAYVSSYALYDGLMRLRQSQAVSADGTGRMITEKTYDSRGLVRLARQPYYNSSAPGTLYDPHDIEVPAQTVSTFDGAERATTDVFQVGAVEKWRTKMYYAGDRLDVTVPAGEMATSTFTDGRGLTTKTRQYAGNTPAGAYRETTYTYTAAGDTDKVTDPGGNVWDYDYNQLRQKITAADPDSGKTHYTYYGDGQLKTTTEDGRGTTIAYQYDVLGRLTGRFLGSLTGTRLAGWTYDTVGFGSLALPAAKGQLASSSRYDSAGNAYTSAVTEYNTLYQATKSKTTIPATTLAGALAGDYLTERAYNADGSVHSAKPATKSGVTAFGGLADETVTYAYNTLGMPTTVSGLNTYATDAQYQRNGQLSTLNLTSSGAKNVLQYWTYEPGTTRLANHQVLGDFGANIYASDVDYAYDNAGNVLSVQDHTAKHGGGKDDDQCFRYDGYRQLLAAWTPSTGDCAATPTVGGLDGPAPYWVTYAYNAIGGRTQEASYASGGTTTSTYAYPGSGVAAVRPHTVNSVTTTGPGAGTSGYTYNATGELATRNVAGKPGQTLNWDEEGHLASVADTGGTTSYVYDADGNRLIGKESTGTTLYLGDTEYTAPSSGAVAGTRYYTHGSAGLIAVRTSAGLYWQAVDQQGTSQLSFRSTDLSRTQRRSLPFGGNRGGPVTWVGTRGFVGGTTDGTGLVHLGAREYDPMTGRFASTDPVIALDHPESLNPYGYSGNNPTTFTDPSGRSWFKGLMKTLDAVNNGATWAGIGMMVLGTMIDGGGGLLAVTGVGAIIGVPALALGTELIIAGAATTAAGVSLGISQAVMNSNAGFDGGGGSGDAGAADPKQPYKYEREKQHLMEEHNGEGNGNALSETNTRKALDENVPEGTEPTVDFNRGPGGDIMFKDSEGNVVLRREIKTTIGTDRSFDSAMSEGRGNLEKFGNEGELFIQVPEGTSVFRVRQMLTAFRAQRARGGLSLYNKIKIRVVDPQGNELYSGGASEPPPSNMGHSRDPGGT
ncbi:RHS repeat domain-containing protein [Hamadaea tsunoensis]|uniref:RHS repeat domain-containing protein n=1 Tax=Hamadaea tsunoensis TaxID=53368 RepID=UPI000421872E|nr:RHS repeat-associated core domain-containing protein [Hamadaea tsunoensis]